MAMTQLTTQDLTRIVAANGLPDLLGRLVDYLEADFRRWPDFDKSARTAAHSDVGVIELMPISDARDFSFKYVNGHPGNTRLGLSTVVAFGVLADMATGMPTLISELTLTTALRTAATSVMAAKVLARKDSRTMALIGNGAQSEFQALAFHHLLGIQEVRVYDVDPAATDKLVRNLAAAAHHAQLRRSASIAQAVRGADIVTTVTADKANADILTAEMIEPGMHINGVGGDCPGKTELATEVVAMASVFVEFEPQSRIEGEVQQMAADFPVTELWRVLTMQAAGRRNAAEVTLFDSVGFALEDYSALRLVRDCAIELDLGHEAGLIPSLRDPKDLFGELAAAPAIARLQAA
jgi:ornithine cyclodeaminase